MGEAQRAGRRIKRNLVQEMREAQRAGRRIKRKSRAGNGREGKVCTVHSRDKRDERWVIL